MGKKRTQFDVSLVSNMSSYQDYLDIFIEYSMSMFEWKGLPDTVDSRFIELTLLENGSCLFFKDDVMGFLSLPFSNDGELDIYNIPTCRRAYANNGYQNDLDKSNSVIIWNNYMHIPSYQKLFTYAVRLYNLDRIIDVNCNAQKTPVLVQGDTNQRQTLINLYKEYDGNSPVIFGDKNIDMNSLKAISTAAPYVSDKIMDLRGKIWNQCLTYLGISHLIVEKKSNMVSNEIGQSVVETVASRENRMGVRKKACEEINRMFALNVDCVYRFENVENGQMFRLKGGDAIE